jgi:hypothetical protein
VGNILSCAYKGVAWGGIVMLEVGFI